MAGLGPRGKGRAARFSGRDLTCLKAIATVL